jgi:uncharacterized protein (UPF0548 family)
MFLVPRPSPQAIEEFLRTSQRLSLSYGPVPLPRQRGGGFDVDEEIAVVGSGEAAFARAKAALTTWTQFNLGWVEVFPKHAPVATGTVVAVLIRHLGLWSLNGCRIVYSVGGENQSEFGYAYGTLTNHAEIGEEIFRVKLDDDTGDVSYVIQAASRPRAVLAKIGYPIARVLQARFRRDSVRAVARAVSV